MKALKVQKVEARRITLEFMPEDIEAFRRFIECDVIHPTDDDVATAAKILVGEIYDTVITHPEHGL